MTKQANPAPWEDEPSEIERGLRGSAPDLPSALKSRTLRQCKTRAEAKRRREQRLQWQLTGAVMGVLAIQTMTLFLVDTQNTQLITGNSKPPFYASLSVAELNALWNQRSRQLAQLMKRSELG